LYCFELVSLCFDEQVILNWGRLLQYRPDYPGIDIKQLVLGDYYCNYDYDYMTTATATQYNCVDDGDKFVNTTETSFSQL